MDNIGLMSETVNFIQGSKRNYDSSTMQGGVYFPDNEIPRPEISTVTTPTDIVFNSIANNSGNTDSRPSSVNNGFQYFDTTLNKPIYWTGTKMG